MFISNKLTPAEIFAELIKGRRTSADATKRFEALRHDKDLVPRFTAHIDLILDVYMAYRIDAHDIQSLRDDGVDVLLRFENENEEYRVGLQIKSNKEFDLWEKNKLRLIETLKAQYSAATQNARVNDYYIILCANDVPYRKRIRTICSEFKNFGNCTIIEPQDALGFFDMSEQNLIVRTTRLLCGTDTILRAALDEAESVEAEVAFFVTSLVCHTFAHGCGVTESILGETALDWSILAENGTEQNRDMTDVIEKLLSSGILAHDRNNYAIDTTHLPAPICALYFDLHVRNLANDSNIRDYIVDLLELADRAKSELEDYNAETDEDDDDL